MSCFLWTLQWRNCLTLKSSLNLGSLFSPLCVCLNTCHIVLLFLFCYFCCKYSISTKITDQSGARFDWLCILYEIWMWLREDARQQHEKTSFTFHLVQHSGLTVLFVHYFFYSLGPCLHKPPVFMNMYCHQSKNNVLSSDYIPGWGTYFFLWTRKDLCSSQMAHIVWQMLLIETMSAADEDAWRRSKVSDVWATDEGWGFSVSQKFVKYFFLV